MTFYIGLLLALPHQEELYLDPKKLLEGRRPTTECTIWHIEYTLDLSALRLNPENSGFRNDNYRRQAAAYLLDAIWSQLGPHYDSGEAQLAPEFMVLNYWTNILDRRSSVSEWESDFAIRPRAGEFIRPTKAYFARDHLPSERAMITHNEALKNGALPKTFEEFRDPLAPMLWVKCEEMARWISGWQANPLSNPLVESLKADPRAWTFFRVWERMLEEFGTIGGRVIVPISEHAISTFYDG